ncbi:MAG: MFS transporter [Alistipes sp.]|nr:MFS transporter [Candidatus Alistipes equi]
MNNFYKSSGLPKSLQWGFFGVLIFMMGDGIEQTWLSRFITDAGFNSSELFAVYGITTALSAWLSGVISETFGIKRTMFAGLIIYLLGVCGFVGLGITQMNYATLLTTYAIKGLGFPLFAYSFMVWITYRVEKDSLSSAQGWFWFVFTGGLNVLGAYFGAYSLKNYGVSTTLWCAALFAVIGAIFALWVNRCESRNLFALAEEKKDGSKLRELVRGLGILKRERGVLLGGIVRVINTTSQFAFVVFMPLYMRQYGIDDTAWASIWGSIFLLNIIFNLIFGIIGDKIGWSRTIVWFGCCGCAITVLLFYYAPQICNNFYFILLCGMLWCVMLAGYVPLSALVPSLVEKDKGAAVSVLNLGAGLAAFVGPLLVRLLEKPIGYSGIAWTLSALYLLSAVLTVMIRPTRK